MSNQTVLTPGDDDYENDLKELAEYIADTIKGEDIDYDDDRKGYPFDIEDLEYCPSSSPSDQSLIETELKEAIEKYYAEEFDEYINATVVIDGEQIIVDI